MTLWTARAWAIAILLAPGLVPARAAADTRNEESAAASSARSLQEAVPESSSGGPLGAWKGELKAGPSFSLNEFVTQFRIQGAIGFDFLDLGRHRLYAVLPGTVGMGNDIVTLTFLPQLELDLALFESIPLWAYGQLGVGVGFFFGGGKTDAALGFSFGGGLKYILGSHWDLILEPVEIEVFPVGFRNVVPATYTVFVGVGYNM
jgi:hypothetical protein